MEKPDFVTDGQTRNWSNAFSLGINSLLFCMFPALVFTGFLKHGSFGFVIAAVILLYLIYELTVFSFVRVMYLDGILEFRKPLRKYSLLFRKKEHCLCIHPDEWTEVYRYSFKGGRSYYFRNRQTAAYFVSTDGLSNFSWDLKKLFPTRIKENDDFPKKVRKRMKKELPERVF